MIISVVTLSVTISLLLFGNEGSWFSCNTVAVDRPNSDGCFPLQKAPLVMQFTTGDGMTSISGGHL